MRLNMKFAILAIIASASDYCPCSISIRASVYVWDDWKIREGERKWASTPHGKRRTEAGRGPPDRSARPRRRKSE